MLKYEFSIDQQEDEDLRCPICNYYFSSITKPYLLPCNHNLCHKCIESITKKNMYNCPICRKPFLPEEKNNFQVNFAFLNLVIKILKTKVIYCKKCSKIFNWIDHHSVCEQNEFKETNEILEEVQSLAEDCFMILKYMDKHKNILQRSRGQIHQSVEEIMDNIRNKFYENFKDKIELFFSHVPDLNYDLYFKEMLKFLQLCKPLNLKTKGDIFIDDTNIGNMSRKLFDTPNNDSLHQHTYASNYNTKNNINSCKTTQQVKKTKTFIGDFDLIKSNKKEDEVSDFLNIKSQSSNIVYNDIRDVNSSPFKKLNPVNNILNNSLNTSLAYNNYLSKTRYNDFKLDEVPDASYNSNESEEIVHYTMKNLNLHSQMNSDISENLNCSVDYIENNQPSNVKITPPKKMNSKFNNEGSVNVSLMRVENNTNNIINQGPTQNNNIVNLNYNFNLKELIEDGLFSSNNILNSLNVGGGGNNTVTNSSSVANKKQKIIVRNDKVEIITKDQHAAGGAKDKISDKIFNKNCDREDPNSQPLIQNDMKKLNKSSLTINSSNNNLNLINPKESKILTMKNQIQPKIKNMNINFNLKAPTLNNNQNKKPSLKQLNKSQSASNPYMMNKTNENILVSQSSILNIQGTIKPMDKEKSQHEIINLLLQNFNKTKEIVSKIMHYSQQIEFTAESIKRQITQNHSHMSDTINRNISSLYDNITLDYKPWNRKFLINLIEGTKKIWLFDVRKTKSEVKEFENLKFKLNMMMSIEYDDSDLIFITGGKNQSFSLNLTGIFHTESNDSSPYSNLFMIIRWSNKTIEVQGQMPRKRAMHSSVFFDNKLYVIGGAMNEGSSGKLKECECYNLIDKRWELMPSMNQPRCNPTICIYNKQYLYAFRGGSNVSETHSNSNSFLDTIEYLDITHITQGWNLIRVEDPGMSWISCTYSIATVLNENKILICGGLAQGNKMLNCSYIYDPVKKTVYKSKDILRSALFNSNGTVYENNVFLIDFKNDTNKPFGVHIYDIENNMWKFNQG
jgi:hypothetical protein